MFRVNGYSSVLYTARVVESHGGPTVNKYSNFMIIQIFSPLWFPFSTHIHSNIYPTPIPLPSKQKKKRVSQELYNTYHLNTNAYPEIDCETFPPVAKSHQFLALQWLKTWRRPRPKTERNRRIKSKTDIFRSCWRTWLMNFSS